MMPETRGSNQHFHFFIGTNAELIKVMPVIREFKKHGIVPRIIASGQNKVLDEQLLRHASIDQIDLELSHVDIPQNPRSLFLWFVRTAFKGYWLMRDYVNRGEPYKNTLIVHGDTISTVMGALLGKLLHFEVAHIEAGLRSFNLLRPFPEELDRTITSHLADVHFCSNDWAMNNLEKSRGRKINTRFNTLLESIQIALNSDTQKEIPSLRQADKYFIFVVHRQENIYNRLFLEQIIAKVT
ncbi:MAG: UDP-N-acetylglucosamine 2-epimerase, partial [Actinomycetota bacterium]|nr:UDP-N-acetylglucosamine 2-epimerase [Actinomycetota bacterium]